MNGSHLTERAEEAVVTAQNQATANGNPQIETLHLRSALLGQEDGLAAAILRLANVNPNDLRRLVDQEIARLPRVGGDAQISPSPSFRSVWTRAQREATKM